MKSMVKFRVKKGDYFRGLDNNSDNIYLVIDVEDTCIIIINTKNPDREPIQFLYTGYKPMSSLEILEAKLLGNI